MKYFSFSIKFMELLLKTELYLIIRFVEYITVEIQI